jgi:cephalosporin hydroxylase
MSTERIFGGWDSPPQSSSSDEISSLWHLLAAQWVGTPDQRNNLGLSQRRAEITMLWELYVRAKPKVVLEIGVAQGGTFASWCYLGQPYSLIIGIDRCVDDCRPRQGDPVSGKLCPIHLQGRSTTHGGGMYAHAKSHQAIIPINGWSHSPSTIEELKLVLVDRKIEWLFHDASHSADMARKDYAIYRPFMAEGSVMAFHDIQPSAHPDCNKSDWWAEVKEAGDYSAIFEFLGPKNSDSMGIGVIIL